jgi:hypothetical protein
VKKFCFSLFVLLAISFVAKAQMKTNTLLLIRKNLDDTSKYFSLHVLPSNYYSSHVGFFCKKELQVQNVVKVPLRFRLGSVSYCDAMEGKNNSHP